MIDINDGGPAFPRVWVDDGRPAEIAFGMFLRDYFAAKAMAAILRNCQGEKIPDHQIAIWAYETADAMLAVRVG